MRRRPSYGFNGATDSKSEQLSIEMERDKKKSWRRSQFEEISSSGYVVQYQVIEPDDGSELSEAKGWVSWLENFSFCQVARKSWPKLWSVNSQYWTDGQLVTSDAQFLYCIANYMYVIMPATVL